MSANSTPETTLGCDCGQPDGQHTRLNCGVPIRSFLAEHKRAPTARRDGIVAWLRDQVEYLESVGRTSYGDGALGAYKSVLAELDR